METPRGQGGWLFVRGTALLGAANTRYAAEEDATARATRAKANPSTLYAYEQRCSEQELTTARRLLDRGGYPRRLRRHEFPDAEGEPHVRVGCRCLACDGRRRSTDGTECTKCSSRGWEAVDLRVEETSECRRTVGVRWPPTSVSEPAAEPEYPRCADCEGELSSSKDETGAGQRCRRCGALYAEETTWKSDEPES